jgi:hypothetical protein
VQHAPGGVRWNPAIASASTDGMPMLASSAVRRRPWFLIFSLSLHVVDLGLGATVGLPIDQPAKVARYLSDSDFVLTQNTKLPTNAINKSKNDSSAKAVILFRPTARFAPRACTWAKPNKNKYSSP